jgi:cytochrome oxidase Cu insertion factor (SCO1/SenC/PrrC family)
MNKQAIILVFAFFLAPVIIAVLLHSQWFSWQPGGTRNHGELIQPVIPLPDFEHPGADGETLSRNDLLERWQLVHLRASACDEACLDDLYWLRQVRLAQDRHQPDVGLLLISSEPVADEVRVAIQALADDFRIVEGEAAAALAASFPADADGRGSYILDPMANIILRYPADADPNGIRRDLRRLLTWTQRN